MPTIINEAVEFNLEAKKTIRSNAKNAPTKEAIQINQELFSQVLRPKTEDKNTITATPKPAADVIPKTDGSAKGFLNNS